MALTYGSRGIDVSTYQKKMLDAGFNPGAIDGIWGDKTEAANKAYQASLTAATNKVVSPTANPLDGMVGLRNTAERMGGTVGWDPTTGATVNGAKIDTTGMKNVGGSWYGDQNSIMSQLATTKAPEYQAGGGMFKPEDMQGLIQKILNPDAFSYDPNTDPAYQSILARYTQEGEKAFNNNLADLTSATGGRLNSWAAGQASQARNNMIGQANDSIPGLMQLAYGMYSDKQRNNYSALDSLMGIDDTMYGRSRDSYGDFKDNVGTALDLQTDSRNYDRDVMESDRTYDRGILESDRNYNLNLSQERRIASGSGSTASDESIAGMGTPQQVNEYYDTLKMFGNGGKTPAELYTAATTTIRGDLVKIMGEKLTNQLISDLEGMDKVVGQTKAGEVPEDPTLGAIYSDMLNAPDPVAWLKSEAPYMTDTEIKQAVSWLPKDNTDAAALLAELLK